MVATEPAPSVDSRFRGSDEQEVETKLQPFDLSVFFSGQALTMKAFVS